MVRKGFSMVLALVVFSSPAWSWGSATHKFINKEAAIHLPPSFPFFANNIQWISDHAADADNRKNSDPTEAPKHFIDIEDYPEFKTHTLSHNYDTLVAIHGVTFVTNTGVVPWAIIWSFDSLTNCLRRGDSARALQFAADLGHYVGDAHQPLHVTSNYDGAMTGNNGVHARYESTMLQSYNYLSQVTVVAKKVHFIPVPIDTNFAFIMHGNGLVDSILHADTYAKSINASYGSSYYAALWAKTGSMTQNQIQDASVDLANLWYTAAVIAGLYTDTTSNVTLSATPAIIAFGNVPLGSTKDTTISLENTGIDTLYVTNISSSANAYSVVTTSATLAPGHSLVDTVRFSPTALGSVSGKIIITSNASSSPDDLQITGNGTGNAQLHLVSGSISFGSVRVGQSKDTTFAISNNGNDSLKVSGIVVGSAVLNAGQTVPVLPPGHSYTDTISFAPSAPGTFQGIIVIMSNSATSPDTVRIDGMGEATTGIAAVPAGVPQRFELSQNYPNPFNPSTMIRYALPFRSAVRIQIFNVLGQSIAELVSGEQSAGYREVVWNAAVPSGMYFCRIEAKAADIPGIRFADVKKMLLLK